MIACSIFLLAWICYHLNFTPEHEVKLRADYNNHPPTYPLYAIPSPPNG